MTARVKRGDLVLGLAFAGLGAGIAFHASGLPTMGKLPVGPGLFPTITGAGMVVFGLALAIGAVISRPAGSVEEAATGGPMLRLDVALILAMLVALVFAMPHVGFLVAGTVFAAGAARLGGAGWIGSVLFGALASAALYAVFVHALGVPLPRGILGF